MSAREWLISGGGGFEDGEDGIRACTMSAENAIELMDEYAEYKMSPVVDALREIERTAMEMRIAEIASKALLPIIVDALTKAKRQWENSGIDQSEPT